MSISSKQIRQLAYNVSEHFRLSTKDVLYNDLLPEAMTTPLSIEGYTDMMIKHIASGGHVRAAMEDYQDEKYLIVHATDRLPNGILDLSHINTIPVRLIVQESARIISPLNNTDMIIGYTDGHRTHFQTSGRSPILIYEQQADVLRDRGMEEAAVLLEQYIEEAATAYYALNDAFRVRHDASAQALLGELYDDIKSSFASQKAAPKPAAIPVPA